MKKYKLLNNCRGWAVFVIASIVYLMTAEPTASWWDCGEYIATTAKLQVGHPPGAPTFQIIGRLFVLLAGGNTAKIALMVNSMSALCSGFTILFLFWSITMLAKKLIPQNERENMSVAQMTAVFGSGVIGALAYTFSDTFWFSAVEGEVYAMSSCFTAIVFWAILKWDEQSDDVHNLRWIVLIAFLIGVAIGIHLLNILTIPAITYIIYFKKYSKTTKKGFIIAGLISVFAVAVVMYFIIPQIVNLASKFEVFFVNGIGLPFNSGTIIYFVLLFGLLIYGLYWSDKKLKPVVNTTILSVLFLILGYSTFATLIIRANANTPINENAPKDAVSLLTYLNREQYGDTPLLYGPYYTAQLKRNADGSVDYDHSVKYVRDKQTKKYKKIRRTTFPNWEDNGCTVFPRMYSTDDSRRHIIFYKMWTHKGENDYSKPSFGDNLAYFFRYQVNFMYWRYFMWNFAGRQNDIQSYGLNYANPPAEVSNGTKDLIHGNWISGIKFLDEARLGPQKNLPSDFQNNKGRNTLYFLPLLLGIAGLIYHIKKDGKNAFVVFLLFFMTGLAIVLYLNQPPCQPRERDYAYAGSFYAFAIWIGLGVFALCDWLKNIKIPENVRNFSVAGICLLAVPVLMACQEWDDHDRSGRFMARDFARNYLESCQPNSILITFGDNDTFPLWYDQEVEGIRTDVRVLNYTLSGMGWYVEQLYNKLYNSDKIAFTLDKSFYTLGQDLSMARYSSDTMELADALKHINKVSPTETPFNVMKHFEDYDFVAVVPTNNFKITFDKAKAAAQGIYPKELVDGEKGEFVFSVPVQQMDAEGYYKFAQLPRSELMLLDILATNRFERPIYVVNPYLLRDAIPDIMNYVIQEGLVYRIVPYPVRRTVFSENSYDLYANKFTWGNVNKQGVYLENAVTVSNAMSSAQQHALFAQTLVQQGERQKAVQILDRAVKEFPSSKLPYDSRAAIIGQVYCQAGQMQKGHDIFKQLVDYYKSYIRYYDQFKGKKARCVEGDKNLSQVILVQLYNDLKQYNFTDLTKEIEDMPQLQPYLASLSFSNQFGQMITDINNAVRSLSEENASQQAVETLMAALEQLENVGESIQDSEVKAKIVEVTQFIHATALRNNIQPLIEKINQSNVLNSYVAQGQGQTVSPNFSLMR
ncbi:MAG: DUF2723 domain-containing protein [Bacteroidales bacterium]|nr:DUF2723 domain-containing protein [Bacteroidales bacterium]